MEDFIGTVQLFAGAHAPRGWASCDGRLLPISQYADLFSILGTRYGGDGRNTFALPKIAPLDADPGTVGYIICVQGMIPPSN